MLINIPGPLPQNRTELATAYKAGPNNLAGRRGFRGGRRHALVGHRGVGPRTNALSGRPLQPAGSWPAEAERVERSRPKLARFQGGCSHQSASASRAERARVELARPKLNCFRGSLRHRSDCLSMADGGRFERPQVARPDLRFPAGHLATRSTIHERNAESSNLTVLPAHRLAGEPGTPVRFTFRTLPETRTRNLPALNGTPLPIGLEGHESGRRDSNSPWQHGKLPC